MTLFDPQRFFDVRQRQLIYEQAEGLCQRCGIGLGDSWHADHRIPWASGGPTIIDNAQALCEGCNLKKGQQMQYADSFVARPFQREVNTVVVDRIRAEKDRTVVLASPGSGKTLAYQSLATRLIREGLIDYVAVFVPRVALAQQCETSWMHKTPSGAIDGLCTLFDSTKRLGMIRHKVSDPPLTLPHELGSGFVSTYSALVSSERMFLEWANRNVDRFLLIADEAQFCGAAGDKEDGGTKAGGLIERMHQFSRHTLLLTGTPYRADNQPLVLADYEPDAADPRRMTLVRDAEASYADGIAEGYLRRFEMHLTEARVTRRTLTAPEARGGDSVLEYNLSDDGSDLVPVLRDEKTWQPLVDRVVNAVKDKQKFNAAYRGLISCMGQSDARRVQKYLQDRYPGLRVGIAVSSDAGAPQELAAFKYKPMDVLVTVRMAFIGYDCPQITVVGILTHYRDGGHLMQLVGRGLRVWDGMPPREQSCVIVAPDDPKMQGFLSLLRDENEQGLKLLEDREGREEQEDDDSGPVQEELSYVEAAVATTTRAAGNESDMEADELQLVEYIKAAVNSAETPLKLKEVVELAGIMLKASPSVPEQRTEPAGQPSYEPPKTEREQISDIKAQTAEAIKQHLYQRGVSPESPGYPEALAKATARVNDAAGYNAQQANTLEKANKRLRAVLSALK
ncbi:HNH endonuclease [Streptomyces sp. ISL-86]|uniref:HNH endonuclease n=1 Tax=Streptomyces sp. ISL-86 TaxID=2819187 RepID=UPI001BEC24B3|nr:HNH endonuclease [Streptomyces sp. ISL-86]MBT2456496.1 HNH endonuclease [Streptomyces sp. ISL-86]